MGEGNKVGLSNDLPLGTDSDLTPYSPRAEKPWNAQRAAHLLRRAGFGFSWEELTETLRATPKTVVKNLLSPGALPLPPMDNSATGNNRKDWTNQQPYAYVDNAERAYYYARTRDTMEWWYASMMTPKQGLREKMVWFWHNHFTSDYTTVQVAQYLFIQNQLFREYAFGDFKALTKKVCTDPAMLIYLDGRYNITGNPNENFAREILELFSIGIGNYKDGTPHYSEADIIDLAKAFTGWVLSGLGSTFNSARFDNSEKTIFGDKKNFGIESKTQHDVIDHIFSQKDKDQNISRSAIFICEKLYQYFVYEVPNEAIVKGMAETLVANNWSISKVLEQLLTSEHFFDAQIIGAKIKSPIDFVVNANKELATKSPMDRSKTDISVPYTHDPITAAMHLSQWMFYPPNVKGWIGGRTWISGVTMPLRINYSKYWVEPITGALGYNFDPLALVKAMPNPDDVHRVLDNLLALFLPVQVSDQTKVDLLDVLLAGGFDYEWQIDQSAQRIRSCIIKIMSLGEYQLL